jgi:transposase
VSGSVIPSSAADLALIEQLRNELALANLKIQALEERLRRQRIAKYGQGSEKLSNAQLELLDLEPGVSNVEVQAESQRERIPRSQPSPRRHPGRQELPGHLPRVEKVLSCTPEQKICAGCGKETIVIGYDESERLDVEPAKYFVEVRKREKRACGDCDEQGVIAAPLPPQIIDKGLASNQVVVDTIVQKYCDHIPLYRQSAILERDTGLDLSRATLDGWVLEVGELLIPVAGAMRLELLKDSYIQADETPVPVQIMTAAENIIKAFCGNTVVQEEVWSSTSNWAEDEMDLSGFWESSTVFCKPMVMQPTIRSGGRRWSMPHAGRTWNGTFKMRPV